MNQTEIEHMRDRYMCAVLTGLMANPNSALNDEKWIARVSNRVVAEILRNREQYYDTKEKLDEA